MISNLNLKKFFNVITEFFSKKTKNYFPFFYYFQKFLLDYSFFYFFICEKLNLQTYLSLYLIDSMAYQ